MNIKIQDRLAISLSVLAWIITSSQLVMLAVPDITNEYEYSIYENISLICWICFGISTVLHTGIVILQTAAPRPKSGIAYLGIAGVATNTLLIVALPIFRGYFAFGGDFSSHIATSLEILATENISQKNFYPALFGLIQIFQVFTGLDVVTLWYLGAGGTYLLGIGFALMIGERLFKEARYSLWLGLAAAIPVAGAYLSPLAPATVSVRFLLMLFYLYVMSRKPGATAYRILLIMLALIYPFLHPLTAMMGVIWLPIIELSLWFINTKAHKPTKIILASTGILGITWFMWFSSFSVLNRQVQSVYDWFLGEAGNQLDRLTSLIDRSRLSTTESIWIILKQENGIIFFTAFSILGIAYLLYKSVKNRRFAETFPISFAVLSLLVISILFVLIGLVGPFAGLDFYRFSRFIVPWSTIGLIAIAHILRTTERKNVPLYTTITTLVASLLIFMGYLAVHSSPFTFRPNEQVTIQQIKCMQWLDKHRQEGWGVRGIWNTYRLGVISLGSSEAQALTGSLTPFPDHFGYDVYEHILDNYPDPFYLIISDSDKMSVLQLWASAEKFTTDDFLRLTQDPTINLVYSNNDCEVWSTTGDAAK